jgi:CheY-like chemotaxis protein
MQEAKIFKKVAIVDDDPSWFIVHGGKLKEETLKKQVQCFSKASNLLDHLALLKQDKKYEDLPDYILIDMYLPDMDASLFLDNYRKIMGENDTPEVFILSSTGNKKSRDLAMQYNFVSTYLKKPVPKDLIEVLIAGRSVDNPPH